MKTEKLSKVQGAQLSTLLSQIDKFDLDTKKARWGTREISYQAGDVTYRGKLSDLIQKLESSEEKGSADLVAKIKKLNASTETKIKKNLLSRILFKIKVILGFEASKKKIDQSLDSLIPKNDSASSETSVSSKSSSSSKTSESESEEDPLPAPPAAAASGGENEKKASELKARVGALVKSELPNLIKNLEERITEFETNEPDFVQNPKESLQNLKADLETLKKYQNVLKKEAISNKELEAIEKACEAYESKKNKEYLSELACIGPKIQEKKSAIRAEGIKLAKEKKGVKKALEKKEKEALSEFLKVHQSAKTVKEAEANLALLKQKLGVES